MNGLRKIILILSLFFSGNIIVYSQTETQKRIDSLNVQLKSAREDTTKVNLLNALIFEFFQAAEFKKGREVAATSITLADKLGFKKGKADALRHLGTIEWETGDYEKAMEYILNACKIYLETGHKLSYGHSLNSIGNIHWAKSDYANAIKHYKLALKIYEELKDTAGIVRTTNNMGSAYGMQGNHQAALSNYYEVLRLTRVRDDKTLIALCTRNIGETYFSLKNYPEALKNYEEALSLYRQVGRKVGLANTYRILGKYYETIGQYPEALVNYNYSFKLFTEMGDAGPITQATSNIGRVHLIQGNYEEALKCFRTAAKAQAAKGIKQPLVANWINIGDVLYRQAKLEKDRQGKAEKLNEAVTVLNKAVVLANEIGVKDDLKNAYGILSGIYNEMKDYNSALDYYTRHVTLKDSLMNNETTRKLEQQRTQYEVEKAVAEEKVAKEKALSEARIAGEKKLADERLLQERLLADERVANEKRLADERARHELQATEEKYLFELALADERTEQERIKADEQLKKEQALAGEKYRSDQALAASESEQEREKAAIKRRNELLLMGVSMLLIALVFVFLYQRQRIQKQRAIERADAIHRMTELELQSLRAQLNPHFMFNSLNAIQELILMEDNERSHVYLSRFSKLIRMLLDNANQPFVPLKKELDFLDLYLSLEKLRIPDLEYRIDIEPGIDANKTAVPNMMLQPYIENAIWHGLSPKQSDKKLLLRIHGSNGSILYDIEDNGIGREKAAEMKSLYRKEHKSKGMELLTKRFKLLNEEFGSEIKTDITDITQNGHAGGTRVSISVPKILSASIKETFV